ncbi:MAG: acetyltransferase family [Oscillospiraceae bacterium]|nr:acetyltransferase family [Oscillospiraceae bacterium]
MSEIILERLVLRPVVLTDAQAIFEYSSRPSVGPNAGWKPHESIKETLDIMNLMFLEQETVWGIVIKKTGELIGTIGLIADPKRENSLAKMVGYAISDLHWGRGYMTEAVRGAIQHGFDRCGLTIISAYCYPENVRSRRVIEKCGFVYEGTLRLAEQLFTGEVRDNMCFSLTAAQHKKTGASV